MDNEKINWDKEADVCEAKEYSDYYDLGDMNDFVRNGYESEFYVLVHESLENAISQEKGRAVLNSVCFRVNLKQTDNITAFYADADCDSMNIKKGDCIIVQIMDSFPEVDGVYIIKTENGTQYKHLNGNANTQVIARVLEIRRSFL